MKNACVYWITGLANSGKTTLGSLLVEELRTSGVAAVHLDGDRLREVYGDAPDYDPAARKRIALRNARLCALLSEQGISVVCSTISLFHEVQRWNRKNIPGYKEIYLRVPIAILQKRDQRQIYQKESTVAGRDYAVEEPQSPDLILDSDDTLPPEALLKRVTEAFFPTDV